MEVSKRHLKSQQLVDILQGILCDYLDHKIELQSIIVVGSNYNIENLRTNSSNSDVDIIVLVDNGDSFQFKEKYHDVLFDISIVKRNDIIGLLLSAYNDFSFSGKIFSSSNKYKIINDKNNAGEEFLSTIRILYDIFKNACIPDHTINSQYLANFHANFSDLNTKDATSLFFVYYRISSLLLDYGSKLIYPFWTTGGYRGKLFKDNFSHVQEYIKINNKREFIFDCTDLEFYVKKVFPVFENTYKGVIYSKLLEKEILSNNISSFFYGFDHLLSNNTILFVKEKELIKLKNKLNYKLLSVKNIAPFYSEKHLELCYDLLSFLSKNYFSSNVEERHRILYHITYEFNEWGYYQIINNSLKALLVLSSMTEIAQENKRIKTSDIYKWLANHNVRIRFENNIEYLHEEIRNSIRIQLKYIDTAKEQKQRNIIVTYLFWGIVKSLRIDLENLEFN